MKKNEVILEAISIRHCYSDASNSFVALNNIDIKINSGKILLLMGPSGSGKTTLIQILGCLLKPTIGKVFLKGKEVSSLDEDHKSIIRLQNYGFVFQSHNLFPTLTATENIMVALDLMKISHEEAKFRAQKLLDQVGLSNKYDAFPANLSGGQKQRVGIARALCANPNILLADEPTAALDAKSGHNVMEMMQKLAHEDNKVVVIVTHDNRIKNFADEIIFLEDGKILK